MNTGKENLALSLRRLTTVGIAALTIINTAPTLGADKFQTLLHDSDVYGASEIAEGKYELGIKRLNSRLTKSTGPSSVRAPVLIDLCAAYTVTRQLDKAKDACDQAIELGWYSGVAYNNRGTYHIAKGNLVAASEDFRRAIKGRGADDIAKDNLALVRVRIQAKADLVKPQNAMADAIER